ncbi:kinase-like domain-containing protein [Aspergillus sergii]|uniref:Kinase-like domain-containing protein n=1 Tax=Aspergillus sergii TaxID=1034303 RepID=A0A5N6XIW3_9EURO|nr:kinase-like domain-containing protein [Aspergillus sergii]
MKKSQGPRYRKANSSPASILTCPRDIDIVDGPLLGCQTASSNNDFLVAANGKRIHDDSKDKIGDHMTCQDQDWKERSSGPKMPKYPGLERWILVEKIGDGVSSNVYRAIDSCGEVGDVAIKVIHKSFRGTGQVNRAQGPATGVAPDGLNSGQVLEEVRIMRELNHPNIVKLVDFIDSPRFYFIILELCPGGELFHQIVRLTYFSEELSRHVIHQVAKAVEFLHEHAGIAHRDIKPENLLFYPINSIPNVHLSHGRLDDEDKVDEGKFIHGVGGGGIGKVKLADFGLSKVMGSTGTTTPCGTVGYAAPEIVKDERYSKSVDMWSIGCILYTLLCGFRPFDEDSISSLTQKVASGEYTFLAPWWDDISELAQDLISHLLTVDPKKRYTIKEFLEHPWITQKTIGFAPETKTVAILPSAKKSSRAIMHGTRVSDSFLCSKAVDAKDCPRYHPYCMPTTHFGVPAAKATQIKPQISATACYDSSMDTIDCFGKQGKTRMASAPSPRSYQTLGSIGDRLNQPWKANLYTKAPKMDRSTKICDPPRDPKWHEETLSPWLKIDNIEHYPNTTFHLNLGRATMLERRSKRAQNNVEES